MFRARARARESYCVRGIRFCQPRDITITLTPFDAEFYSDGVMDLRFSFSGTQQARDISAPLVNLRLRAFDVGVLLAGADYGLFWCCHG